ncbi:hypothetical protein CZP2022_205 [Vibrio phage C-ZP2022]|nr:hypothetical protein CZP2022_205 [Vibrio phage C-ZP2022]
MRLSEITVGKKLQFSLYGEVDSRTSIVGEVYGTFKGYAVPNANEMRAYHQAIYQLLPEENKASTPVDYRECEFVLVMTTEGTGVYVAKQWIIESTLQEVTQRGFRIEGRNWDRTKISEEDIRTYLGQFGIVITSILEE